MSFKDDLGEALVKAVGFYNGGCDPNEAIVKSAQEMGFNLDQTDRLVEKFNTARTINYFERNPDDRTQNFDIASKEKVAEYLFGDRTEKKASASSSDGWYDYSFYDGRESDYFAPPAEKSAEDAGGNSDLEDRHGVSGYSTESLQDMILKRASEHAEQARMIRDGLGMLEAEMTSSLSKIASAVASGYDPGARYAEFRAACCGLPSFKAMDGLVPDYVKRAADAHSERLRRANVVDLGDMQPLADELAKIAELSEKASELEREADRHEAYRKAIVERLEKIAAKDNGGGKNDEYDVAREFLNLGNATIVAPAKKVVGIGRDTAGAVGGKGLSEYMDVGFLGSKEDIEKAMFGKGKKDTSLSEHIDNLRRSTILQDLYENDPILQEADPNALADAYRTIVQTAPDMSLNKEVVRAVLRQSVNSMAVSPFDAKQWADLENVLGKNRMMASGKVPPK